MNPSHDHLAHTHNPGDTSLLASEKGIRALKWSFVWLALTAGLQVVVVLFSGSVALLADTIHNAADAFTAIPLYVAFKLSQRKPTDRFTYGYGRMEDFAGTVIVLIIFGSVIFVGYETVTRFLHPRPLENLALVIAASVVGFIGNEGVAMLRIKTGKEIRSAALVADGYHARLDGLTSLAVIVGAVGAWIGYPRADSVVGVIIAVASLKIVWDTGKAIFIRMLDGVDPKVVTEVRETASQTPGVEEVSEVRLRWLGHRMHAEINIAVNARLSVVEGHGIAEAVLDHLLHHLPYLSHATIHVDPSGASGEKHHPR